MAEAKQAYHSADAGRKSGARALLADPRPVSFGLDPGWMKPKSIANDRDRLSQPEARAKLRSDARRERHFSGFAVQISRTLRIEDDHRLRQS
jgi:hypothetical protein